MVALAETEKEVHELTYIYKIVSEGFRFGNMGKDAYKRMKKGDFTNTPNVKKDQKEI